MRSHIRACGCTWCASTASTRSSVDLEQGKRRKSRVSTNDNGRAPNPYKGWRRVPSWLKYGRSTRDGINGWTPAYSYDCASRCTVEGTLSERHPAKRRHHPGRECLARRCRSACAHGVARAVARPYWPEVTVSVGGVSRPL